MPTIVMLGQRGLPARSGGVEKHVEYLATGLAERGHRVIVFGRPWYVGQSKAPQGVEQVLTNGIRTKHLDAITHTFTAILKARELKPDIVHIHGVGIALTIPFIRFFLPKAKIVTTFHCIDRVREKWGFIARFALHVGEWMACHLSDRTVTISEELVRYCAHNYGVQTSYVTHPIPDVQPIKSKQEFLDKHSLVDDGYFLFVGRMLSDKGAHLLIEAYAQAVAEGNENVKQLPVVLVGASSFTDEYAKRLIQRAAQIENVYMLGEKTGDELIALQSGAAAHVFPYASEGLSLAIIEACQQAKTVIATDIEANRLATGGWMVPIAYNDIESIKQALIRVAERTVHERQQLGARARAHVIHAHDFDDRCNDMIKLYADVLGISRDLVTPISLGHHDKLAST